MAQPWTKGAVHVWVGVGGSHAAVYLGTGERAPRVSRRRRFAEVPNDLGGQEPFDWSYQGSSALVTVKLTRWNESTLLALEDVVGPTNGTDLAGSDAPGDIGALMVTEGLAVPLWIAYSYAPGGLAPQPAMAGLRTGWHMYAAWLEGPDDHEGGTDPASVMLIFRCARVYDPSTGAFKLYDRNMSGLPNPD